MNEQIILSSGISESELLRTLALHGKSTMGLRVLNGVGLAKTMLMKSGESVSEEFLTRKEEPSVIYSFLKGTDYFSSASYADAEKISSSLYSLRHLITESEHQNINKLSEGGFTEKNRAVIDVYLKYMDELKKNNRIDSVALIRKAFECGSLNAGITVLKEFPLTPLESKLAEKASGGNIQEISVSDLFDQNDAPADIKYLCGYGAVNEIENIFSYIYKNNIPLDKCLICCPGNSSYIQLLRDITSEKNIPVSFGTGFSCFSAYPAKLLSLLYEWNTSGYNGRDALRNILTDECFSRDRLMDALGLKELSPKDIEELSNICGNLRISYDSDKNRKRLEAYKKSSFVKQEYIRYAEKLAGEFEKGPAAFLDRYSVIRKEPAGTADKSALAVLTSFIRSYETFAPGEDIHDIIPELLKQNICSAGSVAGSLYVSTLSGAFASMRENLFVVGLDSLSFPGNPKENYILLDKDYLIFADENTAPTSDNIVTKKNKMLSDLVHFASGLGCSIFLSYSGYSLSELKEQNPSSVLFELFREKHPGCDIDAFTDSVCHSGFFENGISVSDAFGKAYINKDKTKSVPDYPAFISAENPIERPWSPSALDLFFACPRHFYLSYIEKIMEPEEDDPFTVINPADSGSLVHSLMEKSAFSDMSKEEFLKMSESAFDDYLLTRPPVLKMRADKEKNDFMKMMSVAFKLNSGNKVVAAEKEISCKHESGILLHGKVDRIEQLSDGTYIVADYKTKRKVDHIPDDIDTCLQVVVYAYIAEQCGYDIKSCEYRYVRLDETVRCAYGSSIKDALNSKINEFRKALEDHTFPRIENNNNCKYCKMNTICKYDEEERKGGAGK